MNDIGADLSRWQLKFPAEHVVIAEVVAATLLVALARTPWWLILAALSTVTLIAGLRYRGHTLIGWLRLIRPTATGQPPVPAAVELGGIGTVGMGFTGRYITTMIALYGRPWPTTELVPEGVQTDDTVPLEAAAALLRQFGGLQLHSIDVVSCGSRTGPDGRYTPRYDEIIGDRSAVGARRTWLVLRLCPQACIAALSYRASPAQAAAAATERIRQAVVREGCRAVTAGPGQFAAAAAELAGHDMGDFSPHFTHLRAGGDYVTSYRIAGRDLTSRLLSDLWTVRTKATVVTVRMWYGAETTVVVGALVRFHTEAPLTHPPMATLHPIPGQQVEALRAPLPLGDDSMRLSPRELSSQPLAIPVGPSGVLLGMSPRGTPLLMPLVDPLHHSAVCIAADFDVAVALLLRACAAGASAVIHTDRPAVWEPICDERMTLSTTPTDTPSRAVLHVADGPAAVKALLATVGERGHSVVYLTDTPPPGCDVTIRQSGGGLTVSVGGRRFDVTLMRPRNEAEYVSHAQPAGEP